MKCFFFHDWEWIQKGEGIYCNLMGGCFLYAEMRGTCKECGAIKSKLMRL